MRSVKRTIRGPPGEVIAPPPQWIEPELCKLVTRIPATSRGAAGAGSGSPVGLSARRVSADRFS